jgi:CheY-like chemotaxis protein
LIVDERPENRRVLLEMLAPLGFILSEAENGQEALVQASLTQPEVILMDLVMPVMDGFEATRQLRKLPLFQDTVIIAVSASVFGQDQQTSIHVGCNAFLSKPVQYRQLLQTIEQFLAIEWRYDGDPDEAIPNSASQQVAAKHPSDSTVPGDGSSDAPIALRDRAVEGYPDRSRPATAEVGPSAASHAPPAHLGQRRPEALPPAQPPTPSLNPGGDVPSAIAYPSSDLLQELHTLAQMGAVLELRARAARLAETNPNLEAFVAQVQQLAASFQVNQLQQFLTQCQITQATD